jgi:hypothetical protein
MTIATTNAVNSTKSPALPPQLPAKLTGSGLDQLVSIIVNDPGLLARISASDISAGAAAANDMNQLIIDAIRATGVANNGDISNADVRDLNTWLRANHLDTFTRLHGDDENGLETGFHLVQSDGAKTALFGHNAVNTVADGLYHLAFATEDNRFVNEDGNANARISSVAEWLSSLLVSDLSTGQLANTAINPYVEGTSGTGLDQLVNMITSDTGLAKKLSNADIASGAQAADAMNKLIVDAIKATGAANNGDISVADLRDINAWLRVDHLTTWTTLHGDDENGQETGFHLVQNDGATSTLFDKNAVNTVADSIYHLGFAIDSGHLLNEDGDKNASLSKVSTWLNGLLSTDLSNGSLKNAVFDPYIEGTTGTGLDQLVNLITTDSGLNNRISTSDISAGAQAADAMNHLLVNAIRATGVADGGVIEVSEVIELNGYLRTQHLSEWTSWHGDDEEGVETGFHLVQNDGAKSELFTRNAVNTVADGLYHLAFEIEKGRLVNEDGDKNASLENVSYWLNGLLVDDLADGSLMSAVSIVGTASIPA